MMQPDVIGTIHKPTGVTLTDADGFEYPEMKAIEGFHVNFQQEVPELSEFKVEPQPETPYRVYAGGIKPLAYKFPDEVTFREYFEDMT